MHNVFMVIGGSGSCFLIDCLEKAGYKVDARPDNHIHSLNGPPSCEVVHSFLYRSGFEMDKEKSINDNLLDYIGLLDSDDGRVALFSKIHKFKFFSSNNIKNVIALIRHPLHSYMSFVKPERHFRYAIRGGGISSRITVAGYLMRWNCIINEAMELNAKIIRYEFFYEDAAKAGIDTSIFDDRGGWDTSKRNESSLTMKTSDFFYEYVKDNYFKLYDKWEI